MRYVTHERIEGKGILATVQVRRWWWPWSWRKRQMFSYSDRYGSHVWVWMDTEKRVASDIDEERKLDNMIAMHEGLAAFREAQLAEAERVIAETEEPKLRRVK